MKKKILVGSGLSAIVLAGLAFGTKSQEVLAETNSTSDEGVLLDYTIFKEDPVVPKAGYTTPQPRFAQDGIKFTYYTVPRTNWVTTMASLAKTYGTTAQILTNLNSASLANNRVIYSGSYIYAGAKILINNNGHQTVPNYYYALSMKAPTAITGSNWNKKASIYVNDPNGRYESGKFLNYSLHEHLMSVSDKNNTLTLNGWAVQNNYTNTNGTNNKTAIVAQDTVSKSVVITNASNKAINPSSLYVYNSNNPGAQSLQCPAVDAYLDRPINFNRFGSSANTSLVGCWHNFANAGFQASLNLETLFGAGKQNKIYNLYIANTTGTNAGRILHKPLSARQSVTRTYSNSRFSGTVTFKATGTNVLPNGQLDVIENDLLMRKYSTGSTVNANVNWVGSSNVFKPGRYNITNTTVSPDNGTLYYYLSGTGATAGYKGWAPQSLIDDAKNPAQLSFKIDKWEKFQLNHVDYLSGAKIDKAPNVYTVYSNTGLGATSVTVRSSTFNRITDNKGVVWTLMPTSVVPENKDFTRTFNATNPPADATYKYSKIYKSTVRYVNANTGQEIRSEVKDIEFGKPLSYSYKNLGVVDGSNANFVTYSGKKYKFAGTGISSYSGEFTSIGLSQKYKDDITKYKNNATQSRTVTTSNVASGVDDVIFYFYEPQTYNVNHMRVDSKNNFVTSTGAVTTDIASARMNIESNIYYTGDKVNMLAYGIGNAGRDQPASFGRYFFAGKGKYQYGTVYSNGANMASGKTNFTVPLKRLATETTGTGRGSNAYLFYRREITNPSGEVTIGTDPTTPTVPADKSNPGNGNGTGVAVNPNAYLPSITGQYNWYLTKENNVNSANWNKSKLAMTNVASVGNNNVFAVKNVQNNLLVGGKTAYTSSYTGQTTDLYYGTSAQARKVNPEIGEGIATTSASKIQMKVPTTNGSTSASNVSSIYASRNYTNLVEKVAMNSKIYKGGTGGASNYNDTIGQVAGKGTTLTYQTTYDFTNRVRDNYVAKDSYNGRIFSWAYSYSNPVFQASGKYDYKATSNVDHKVGEESTTPLKKAGDKLVSKVGILRNYTNQGTNNATDTVNNGSANTVTLNETITKVETINPTLKTQSKVKAEENLTYKNDITTNNRLSTRGQTKETFVGYKDSFNGFTYNATNTGYNKYLVQDVDFNFRNVNGSVTSPNMGKVSATGTTTLESGYNYQMGVKVDNLAKLPLGTTTQTVKLNLDNQYGVLSDSGLLIERLRGQALDSSNADYYKTVTQNAFGKAYEISSSDKLVKQTGTYVGYYYLPVDGNSTLKSNTVYTNRNVLSSVGLNDRNIAIDNTFQFSNYLVGSSLDNTAYASFKTSLSKDGDYTDNKIVITSKEKEAIKSSNLVVSKDNVNFRTMNAKEITNTLKKFLGFQN